LLRRAGAGAAGGDDDRLLLFWGPALARDDGHYANSPLKEWFNRHASGKTLCCSFADGYVVKDPEWKSSNGHYQVRIENEWVEVPDDAVITGAQQIRPDDGVALWAKDLTIRCFLPGIMI
jgi:hypothetical protein